MHGVVKRGLSIALSMVMVLMMFTALPSAALAEDDTDAIDIESPEGTGIDDEALDTTETDGDATDGTSDATETDAVENELAPLDSATTDVEGDASEAEEPGDIAPMGTDMVTINISNLGSSNVDNSGNSAQSQWRYDGGTNKELHLLAPNGNYTLTGSNSNLFVSATNATGASITLNGVSFTPPSGRATLTARACTITLVGTNTFNGGSLTLYGDCTINGSGSLTVTSRAGNFGFNFATSTISLSIAGSASVTFKGGSGNTAISVRSGQPPIRISDTAKLTMVNNSTSAETHSFRALSSATSRCWKLTGATLASGNVLDETIIVNVAAGATATVEREAQALSLTYQTHVQNVGWQAPVGMGQVSGTSGQSLRLEGLKINLKNTTGISGSITYATHIQSIGWQTAVVLTTTGTSSTEVKGGLSGTEGKSLRLEAMRINLTGNLALNYDIYYRVHAQNVGWMGWAKNGADAGTAGQSFRLEALQIVIVFKGAAAPADTYNGIPRTAGAPAMIDPSIVSSSIPYNATVHVQSIGDRTYSSATGATILGTTGSSLRLEAITLGFPSPTISINYRVHIQNIGWQDWKTSGQMAGTSGQSLRLEALAINLSGTNSSNYDVYYRTHIQNIGWTGWAKNGQECGSAGYGYRMEAMQIVIVQKSLNTAPGLNANYFYQK